jgi:hypothetical protein
LKQVAESSLLSLTILSRMMRYEAGLQSGVAGRAFVWCSIILIEAPPHRDRITFSLGTLLL